MWIRQCELDAGDDASPPIPAQIASNEEFVPPPPSARQRRVPGSAQAIAEPRPNVRG